MRHSILTINIVVVVDELGDSEIKNAVGAGVSKPWLVVSMSWTLLSLVVTHAAPGADWLVVRQKTISTVWVDGSLPSGSAPTEIVRSSKFADLTKVVWNVSCPYFSLNSTVYHSVRKVGVLSDEVIIHHHGHARRCDKTLPDNRCDSNRSFYDFYNLTDYYHRTLESDAFFVYMPLYGPNEQQVGGAFAGSVDAKQAWATKPAIHSLITVRPPRRVCPSSTSGLRNGSPRAFTRFASSSSQSSAPPTMPSPSATSA